MSSITRAELTETVPHLRAMAAVEPSPEVRAAMLRLAERYAADDFMAASTDFRRQAALV